MISDQDLVDLSEEPELAFVQLEAKIRERLKAKNIQDLQSGGATVACYVEYINDTLAAVKALGLDILANWEVPELKVSVFDSLSAISKQC